MERADVVLDTSVLWSGSSLNERTFRDLEELLTAGRIRLHTPEVVVLELVRHVEGQEKKASREAHNLWACLRSLGMDGEVAIVKEPTRNWADLIRRRLEKLSTIEPLPAVSHAEILRRDLNGRKPFQATGKGYRDTLIWETVLELEGRTHVVLLTKNKSDFGDSTPHPDLSKDIKGATTVAVLSDTSALKNWLEGPVASRSSVQYRWEATAPLELSAIRAEIDGWQPIEAIGVRFGRRLTRDADVEGISVQRVLDVVEFDTTDGYGSFEAELEVEADVTVEIERDQLGLLDSDVRIFEAEAGQDFITVGATRDLNVKVFITYRVDTMDIEEARVEEARAA